ncbi:FAD-dependent monooxygenase [Gordonia sp. NPDC003376]
MTHPLVMAEGADARPRPELPDRTSVLVVGGGPVGLTMGLELEHHGIDAVVIERNTDTTRHPKMDITNGRSMELYRRLGIADELRKVAIASDRPTTVSWVTKAAGWQLASFVYGSVDRTRERIEGCADGTLPLEPPMRVSQVLLEPALRDLIQARSRRVHLQYGWSLESIDETADGVVAYLRSTAGERHTITAQYLVGCDGAGSLVRRHLGIELDEVDLRTLVCKEIGVRRVVGNIVRQYAARRELPPDGRFYLVHFTTSDRGVAELLSAAWHLQSPEGWALISQNDEDIFTLHAPLGVGVDASTIDPREFVQERLGLRFDMHVLVANAWTPRLTVARSYGRERIWLAGDAVHQVTPTGGYGMNTGVGDAAGLAWALAARLQGWGAPGLLTAYGAERRHVALRNREAASRHSLVRAAIMSTFRSAMHGEGWSGERTRRRIGREISDLGNLENEAMGIEFGYRYDRSPAICHEHGSSAPAYRTDVYVPGTRPGVRPPSVFLEDGRAIFDLFASGFTLLRFADVDTDPLIAAATERGVPVTVVDIRDPGARRLYERDLVLIRPDQHVAWRGNEIPADPLRVVDTIRGACVR